MDRLYWIDIADADERGCIRLTDAEAEQYVARGISISLVRGTFTGNTFNGYAIINAAKSAGNMAYGASGRPITFGWTFFDYVLDSLYLRYTTASMLTEDILTIIRR